MGDKLLFSSAFIIDHIFKFHPFGFSWRNLELIPEVVLVNREPNLRKFIEDLMRFYSLTYVRDTVSGIFKYRFRSIIRRELIYLSKTSDLSSAAFNFTLDESLSTKRHYKKKLIELREKYKEYSPLQGDNQFIHSLSFVQTILGDLHFYDKEYDEAVIYYTESIQALRFPNAINKRIITRHQFLLWLRNQLKLGLTLEKIRAFESAYSLYKTLILDTERYLKLIVVNDDKNDCIGKIWDSFTHKEAERVFSSEDHRSIHLVSMPFVALLAVTEKTRTDGITSANLLKSHKDFKEIVVPPLKKINIELVDNYRRNFLQADYYNNVGSILYYKNFQLSNYSNSKKSNLDVFEEIKIKNLIFDQQVFLYCKKHQREYNFFPSLVSFNHYWNALYFLLKSHKNEIEGVIENDSTCKKVSDDFPLEANLLSLCTGYLLPHCADLVNSSRLYYIANVVSKIGDSILASLKRKNFVIPIEKFNPLDITGTEKTGEKGRMSHIIKFQKLLRSDLYTAETVLYTYKLAAALYKKASQNSYYASQMIKILYVIKDMIEINKYVQKLDTTAQNDKVIYETNSNLRMQVNTFLGEHYNAIEEVAISVFKATTWNNEVSNRPQILKYREILNLIDNKNKDRDILYNNINNTSDNREVLILVEGIKMKLGQDDVDGFLDSFMDGKTIISTYGSMNNRYLRMLELKYRSERCYFIMKNVLIVKGMFSERLTIEQNTKNVLSNYLNKFPHDDGKMKVYDIIGFLIQEALFSLRELIKMFNLYDPGYVIGYSFSAAAHSRMGDWCKAYENYKYILSSTKYYKRYLFVLDKKLTLKNEQAEKQTPAKNLNEEINILTSLKDTIDKIKNNNITDNDIDQMQNIDSYKLKLKVALSIENIKKKLKWNNVIEKIDKEIKKMLGSESLAYLESKNHFESAIQYYYKVIQMHTEGKTYKSKLQDVYMLEDDYNDNMAHYTIAAERLRINTGTIKREINQLALKVKTSNLYKYNVHLDSKEKPKNESFVDIETIHKFLERFNEEGA
ncbi:MAG: hypothetical protein V3V14_03865 [Saprospiraceae bacterium]